MVYRITFYMQAPVITDAPIHFDALLSAVHPAMHNIPSITRYSEMEGVVQAPLPLDSAKIGKMWIWCSSSADYSADARPYQDKITKRKVGMDYYYLNKRQTPRTGQGRDRCDSIFGVVCSSVSFFASSNQPSRLSRICKRVKGLGSLRKMGYGKISRFEMEETDLPWQECLIHNGTALRHIPAEMVNEICINRVVVHPPYWLQAQLQYGVAAGQPASLKKEVWLNVN